MAATRSVNLIVIHCAATANGKSVSVDQVRAWHLARGFHDIGYHYLIDVDGTVNMGRAEEEDGAHAQGHNAHSIGVCLVGGVGGPDRRNPGLYTEAQWATLALTVQDLCRRYPGSQVVGHRDLSPDLDGDGIVEPREWIKLCPSFDVGPWLASGMQVPEDQVYRGAPCAP